MYSAALATRLRAVRAVFIFYFFEKKIFSSGPLAPADVRPDAAALQRFNVSSAFTSMTKGDLA